MSDVLQYEVKRVFIASPGDLSEERRMFPSILQHVNAIKAHNMGIHFEPLGWEDTLPGMGRPQELINKDVERCDLFIMLLWKRWGNPSGEYSSGTEEEFGLARKLHQERRRPADIWLYFREVPHAMMADPGEQLTKVLDFRKRIEAERTCLYKHYRSTDDWDDALEKHLCEWLDRAGAEIPPESTMVRIPKDVQDRLAQLERELQQEKTARESAQKQLRRIAVDLAMRAQDAVNAGQVTEAEEGFATALQTYPEPLVMAAYALFLQQLGNASMAEELYRTALCADPTLVPAWSNLGVLLKNTGRQDEAEEVYYRAIETDPKHASTWCNLGVLLRHTGREDEAEAAYRKAIAADARHSSAWYNLGVLLHDRGCTDKAEVAYHNAVEADPQNASAWYNLGVLLEQTGHRDRAEHAYRKAIEADPDDADSWGALADLTKAVGRSAEAEQSYRIAIEHDPSNAATYNEYAYFLWSEKRFGEAQAMVQKALAIDHDHCYANATLGLLEFEKGNLEDGQKGYAKAVSIQPNNTALRQKYHYEYGRALARAERRGKAREQFGAALRVDSGFVPDEDIKAEIEKLKS